MKEITLNHNQKVLSLKKNVIFYKFISKTLQNVIEKKNIDTYIHVHIIFLNYNMHIMTHYSVRFFDALSLYNHSPCQCSHAVTSQ